MLKLKKIFVVCFLILLVDTAQVFAELEISGFVDFLYQDEEEEYASFGMGAFEIDFAHELSPKACFEGAVVVEGDEVGLGQTLVDFKLLDEKLCLQAGLLDIPFGIDYQVFATPDRKLVSPPLVTELMMDGGWGDVGINLYSSLPLMSYDLYVVNGMGEDGGNPVSQLSDNNNAKTIGGRIGISPLRCPPAVRRAGIYLRHDTKEDVEMGLSYAQGSYLDDNTRDDITRMGVDIQAVYKIFKLRAEYIAGKEEIPEAKANKHNGYYAQLLGNVTKKLYGVARYGRWKPEGGDEVTRLTIALGYDFIENTSIRIEFQTNKERPEEDNNLAFTQVVIGF